MKIPRLSAGWLMSLTVLGVCGGCLVTAQRDFARWNGTRLDFDYVLEKVDDKAVELRQGSKTYSATLVNTKGLRRPYEGARFSVALDTDGKVSMCPMSARALPCYDLDIVGAPNLRTALSRQPTVEELEHQRMERERQDRFQS